MPVEIRNSERLAFTTCPQKWAWGYIDKYKAKTPSPALRFGTLVHKSLEAFYIPGIKRGVLPALTFEKLYQEELKTQTKMGWRDEDGTWHEAGQLGVTMLEAYAAHYGGDSRWRVLASEIPFRVPVVDPVTGVEFTYVGVMDGLWLDRESGKRRDLWIPDHKTTGDDPSKKADSLILDEQAGSYWSYGVDYLVMEHLLKKNERLTGMMFNFLRKGKPDERPRNKDGHALNKPTKDDLLAAFPKKLNDKMTLAKMVDVIGEARAAKCGQPSMKQPPPMFYRPEVFRDEFDREMVRNRIIAQARVMHYMRTGKLEIYKVPGVLHNPHCKWCEFKDPCEMHEVGAEYEHIFKTMYTTWNPYADHEIYEGET